MRYIEGGDEKVEVGLELPKEDVVELAKMSMELDRSVNWIIGNCLKLYIQKQDKQIIKNRYKTDIKQI